MLKNFTFTVTLGALVASGTATQTIEGERVTETSAEVTSMGDWNPSYRERFEANARNTLQAQETSCSLVLPEGEADLVLVEV